MIRWLFHLKTEKNLDIQSMYKEIENIAISGIMKWYYKNITNVLQKWNK